MGTLTHILRRMSSRRYRERFAKVARVDLEAMASPTAPLTAVILTRPPVPVSSPAPDPLHEPFRPQMEMAEMFTDELSEMF